MICTWTRLFFPMNFIVCFQIPLGLIKLLLDIITPFRTCARLLELHDHFLKCFKSYRSIRGYVIKTFESFPLRRFAHFKNTIESCTTQRVKLLFLAKLQVLSNHCGPSDCSDYVRHYKLFSATKLKCACSIGNVLIEIRSVYKFQKIVDFDCMKSDPVIKLRFQWGTGTFVISVKLSFTQFPFCYRFVQFVHFHKLLGGIPVCINTFNLKSEI